ncbi:MAG: HAD family phosphatase [Caldilineaceae bacterium]
MIRAVIFDIGGVLIRTEDAAPRRQLEQRLGLEPGQAEYIVFNSPMGQRAQLGEITTAQLWRWVQNELELSDVALAEFQRDFFAGDKLDGKLVDYIRRLKSGYQLAIISNAKDDLHLTMQEIDPAGDLFELVVGSAYERVMKPNAAIFQRTLERLQRQPRETVFIDDFMHNIEGAWAVGMNAIHFQPGLDLAQALAELGVKPDKDDKMTG